MRRVLWIGGLLALLLIGVLLGRVGTRPTPARQPGVVAAAPSAPDEVQGEADAGEVSDDAPRAAMRAVERASSKEPSPLRRCFPGDQGWSPPRSIDALLDRASTLFDKGEFEQSLACSEEATRDDPSSIEAQHDRALALQELGRLDEARDAFALALSLDPEDPETLAGAAYLFINRLPPTNEHTMIGLEYARRGFRRAFRRHTPELAARLALLEGQALNDLGRPREALGRLDVALSEGRGRTPDVRVLYERAVALFELSRFAEARVELEQVLQRDPDDAWAHDHYGLVLERLGDQADADRELALAQKLSPDDFHAPVMPSPEEFRALVEAEVAKLPEQDRRDLAWAKLETADLPDVSDLVAEEPPLSPTILGLFRGSPMPEPDSSGEPASDPDDPAERDGRTIILYRKNLGRAVKSMDELKTQIRMTLLHEIGHLQGEDDAELRSRGLE